MHIALSQKKFVLSNSSITINLSKCEKTLCFLCKGKKVSYNSFYEDKQFLYSSVSVYFTPLKSDFVNITLNNYSQVETVNSKASLFIAASDTVLIEHKIFNSEKETTKVAMSKLQPVYCIPNIWIHLFSTKQILQFRLRVKDNKSSSTFCDKFGDTILSATLNLWIISRL